MKKVVYMVLTLCLVVSIFSSERAFANESENNNGDFADVFGEILYTEEEEEQIEASRSPYERMILSQKLAEEERLLSSFKNKVIPTRAMISLPYYSVFSQQNNYYCAPACVKSVLYYCTGISYTQFDIATALGTTTSGTDPTRIAPYLDSKQSFNYVRLAKSSMTQTQFINHIYSTVISNSKPAPLSVSYNHDLSGDSDWLWLYNTGSHRVSITGLSSDKSLVQISDPMGVFLPSVPSQYNWSTYSTFSVCNDLIW